jgi:hypothetical protein
MEGMGPVCAENYTARECPNEAQEESAGTREHFGIEFHIVAFVCAAQ